MCLVLFSRRSRWPDAMSEDLLTPDDGAPSAEQAITDLALALQQDACARFSDVDDSRKTARIPILRFLSRAREEEDEVQQQQQQQQPAQAEPEPPQLECDICIDNRLAIRNTLLLRHYSSVDPRVRQLAYIVKHWSKRRDINNPAARTLSSYGFVLILIHVLQQLPVPLLPPLQALPPQWDGVTLPEEGAIDECPLVLVPGSDQKQFNTYFYGDPHSPHFSAPQQQREATAKLQRFAARNTDSLGSLLLHFFWTLAFGFDWRRHVVAVRDLQLVAKETKASEDSWKLHQRMAIEDPFETGYDVAHVVRDREFKLLRREFVRAYAVLKGCAAVPDVDIANADATALIDLLCTPRQPAPLPSSST